MEHVHCGYMDNKLTFTQKCVENVNVLINIMFTFSNYTSLK